MKDDLLERLLGKAKELRAGLRGSIQVHELCERLGISIEEDRLLSVDGRLIKRPDGSFCILVKEDTANYDFYPRNRFTIAHELGHYILLQDYGMNSRMENNSEYFRVEKLCNRFAGSLLVDGTMLEKSLWHDPYRICAQFAKIASVCRVSVEVAAREYICNGLEAVVGCTGVRKNKSVLDWGFCSIIGFGETRHRGLREGTCLDNLKNWTEETLKIDLSKIETDSAEVFLGKNRRLSAIIRKRQRK